MKLKLLINLILLALLCNISGIAQAVDYRDPFLGLYHTATPPCVPGNSPPNQYVLIEKDTQNTTGILVTDTMCSDAGGFRHNAILNQSDSTFNECVQLCKFVPTDSLKIAGAMPCGFGYTYYLRKVTPIGIFTIVNKKNEWYMFPNPAINELNVVLPGLREEMDLQVLDINGRIVLKQHFKISTQINVSVLPKGVYVVRIKGTGVNLSKRVVLVN